MYPLLVSQEKAALLSSTLGAWLSQVLPQIRLGLRGVVDGGGGGWGGGGAGAVLFLRSY